MKRFILSVAIPALIACSLPVVTVQGQNKQKPTIWEERAAERLKPLTSKMKMQISEAQPRAPEKRGKKGRRILVFWRCEGFIHTSIPSGNFALQEMARKTGSFTVDLADDYEVFTKKNLKQYDAILFNSTTHLKISEESQRQAILDFISKGKGIIGIHAASDNFGDWEAGIAMMGGQFNGHPWTAGGTWAFKLDDPQHVLNKAFQGKGFWHQDEIYQYKPATYQGEDNLRILLSLDMSKPEVNALLTNPKMEKFNKFYGPGQREVTVSWIRELGKGRLFYTNLGHREETYSNPTIMQHIFDGIRYALGDLKADATPTAAAGPKNPALAPAK